jgi:hypothetical protein
MVFRINLLVASVLFVGSGAASAQSVNPNLRYPTTNNNGVTTKGHGTAWSAPVYLHPTAGGYDEFDRFSRSSSSRYDSAPVIDGPGN